MKYQTVRYSPVRQPLYPGAADASYFIRKSSEILMAILSGACSITVLVLLMAMA